MTKHNVSCALYGSRTTGNTRLVAALLAELADNSGIITASAGELMRKTRLPRNTIKRALRRLVEAGEVRCLISTNGERLGRVSREAAKQAEDGRGIYQLTGAWLPFRKAA